MELTQTAKYICDGPSNTTNANHFTHLLVKHCNVLYGLTFLAILFDYQPMWPQPWNFSLESPKTKLTMVPWCYGAMALSTYQKFQAHSHHSETYSLWQHATSCEALVWKEKIEFFYTLRTCGSKCPRQFIIVKNISLYTEKELLFYVGILIVSINFFSSLK